MKLVRQEADREEATIWTSRFSCCVSHLSGWAALSWNPLWLFLLLSWHHFWLPEYKTEAAPIGGKIFSIAQSLEFGLNRNISQA